MLKTLHSLFFLMLLQTAVAQNGVFDTTFGVNGHRQFSLGDKNTRGNFLLVFADQSFLVVGNSDEDLFGGLINRSLFISKFTADANPDTAFGNNGTISIANGPSGMSYISDAIVQPDGRILISCQINGDAKLMRIDEFGAFDNSFGINGIATADTFGRAAVQPDGKIVVVGYSYDGYATSYGFSRYHADGTLDLSFGTDGTLVSNITAYRFDLPHAIKMQADKMLVVGSSYEAADAQHAAISRFNLDGTPDTAFGTTGTIITSFGNLPGYASYYDLALEDDKIIAVGTMEYQGGTGGYMGTKPVLAKYNSDGSLDYGFGSYGKVILETIFNANDNFFSLNLQPDGKILGIGTSGHAFPNPQSHLNITRMNSNGTLDLTFGVNGTVLTDNFGAQTNGARQIEMLADGKILCLGYTRSAEQGNFDVLLCRINPDHALGTAENGNSPGVELHPNPVSDHLFISGLQEGSTLKLHNSLGQNFSLKVDAIDAIETQVDLSGMSSGVYFLTIESGAAQIVRKLVIE